MEGRSREYSDGGFVSGLAVVGGLVFAGGAFCDNFSIRVMSGVFMTPAVIKYSVRAGMVFSDCYYNHQRSRKFKRIGRNLEGKYLAGELEN